MILQYLFIVIIISIVNSFSNNLIDNSQLMYRNKLLHERILTYNTYNYDLIGSVTKILQIQSNAIINDLTQLHTIPSCNRTSSFRGKLFNSMQLKWNMERGRLDSLAIDKYNEFDQIYHLFIRDVIAPCIGGGRILYQRAPTIRIYTPFTDIAVTELHNDCDYHHQPSEINFWLPLTNAEDSNALWIESRPDLGDWHPINSKYGEYLRFYGNKCRHFTKPNQSGYTRVSLDFRAVSQYSGKHDPYFDQGVQRGSKAKYKNVFDVDGYYSEVIVDKNPSLIE